MTIISHLRAATHESMRIDHRAVAHPRSRIDKHRRHARHTLADVAPVANARSARNNSYSLIGCKLLHRESGFVHPRLARGVDRHVYQGAHSEADENSLLHPRVHAPTGIGGSVRLGRSNAPGVQGTFESFKDLKMFNGVDCGSFVEQLLDLSLHVHSGRP